LMGAGFTVFGKMAAQVISGNLTALRENLSSCDRNGEIGIITAVPTSR
jgi:hypothetical protein